MANRYISTSERTTVLARGVLVLSRLNNMSDEEGRRSGALAEWVSWQETYGVQMSTYVIHAQHDLFNSVNGELWEEGS